MFSAMIAAVTSVFRSKRNPERDQQQARLKKAMEDELARQKKYQAFNNMQSSSHSYPRSCPSSYVVEEDNDFATSLAVAAASDNIALGYAVGGNLTGAVVGSMLNESYNSSSDYSNSSSCSNDYSSSSSSDYSSCDSSSSSDCGSCSSD